MATKNIILNSNLATGHTDIQWNSVTWVITTSKTKGKLNTTQIAFSWDVVNFPSHPHALDIYGSPINYRSHSITITGTWKVIQWWANIVLEWDIVNVADEAWWNAVMIATQTKLKSN